MLPFAFFRSSAIGALALTSSGLATAAAAEAASEGQLRVNVQRSEEAQDCPDSAALLSELKARSPEQLAPSQPQDIEVVFSRSDEAYRAHLTLTGFRQGERSLESNEPSCTAMAHAVAITLTVLLDPSQPQAEVAAIPVMDSQQEEAEPAPATPPRPAVAAPVRAPATPTMDAERGAPRGPSIADQERGVMLMLGLAPGVSYGFTPSVGGGLEGGVELKGRRTGLALLSFVTAPEITNDAIGSTNVMLLGAHLRGCTGSSDHSQDTLEFRLCGQLSGAAIRGTAEGYETVADARYRPWAALGPGAQLARLWGPSSGWRATASLLFPLTRESYVITGENGAYRHVYATSVWALWLGLGAELQIL